MGSTRTDSKAVGCLVAAVVAIGMVALFVPTAAAAPATASSSGPTDAQPGETVTVSVTVTNTGDSAGSYIANVSAPERWSVESQSAPGAIWNDGDRAWLWQRIEPGSSVAPSVRLAVPDNATAGSYEITTAVKSSERIEANTTHTISVGETSGNATAAETSGETSGETNEETPGFGIGAALLALTGVGYAVRRRSPDDA